MKKSYYYLVTKLTILIFAFSLSIHASGGNSGWSSKFETQKVFIENKGQFHIYNSKEAVKYAYDDGSTMIYFTSKGITYSFLKRWKKDGKENEKEPEKESLKSGKSHLEMEAEEHKMEFKTDVVNFDWENSNTNVEIVPEEETSDYYSYTIKEKDGSLKNINYIKAYKKLIYKNLYPNIDVEYIFHPDGGIKYALIVHPGADISKVKMKYDDIVKLKLNGDIHIPTLFGDLIDKAPSTFYADNKSEIIFSHFVKTDKIISFELGAYDHSKTIIIDPWSQTPILPSSNSIWECERDGSGNVYIIGGDLPMKLIKYNAAGVFQWTYNTTWDTANYWLGTLAVDLLGNSYVTSGTQSKISKVNTAGSNVWTNANIGGSSAELWDITFNCDQTRLIIGGTSGLFTLRGSIFDIDVTNGNVITNKIVGYNGPLLPPGLISATDEVRSICSAPNGKYYFLTLDSVGRIYQNFTACASNSSIYKTNSSYNFGYWNPSYRYTNSGFMAIRANKNFVYTQNGATLNKRSLGSLSILSSVAIPGGINVSGGTGNPGQAVGSSGLDIDSCGNVYVGSSTGVYKFDANLTQIGFVSLPFTVFDVAVSTAGNVIVAGSTTQTSGTRTGYVQSIASFAACNPMTLFCCDATICPAGPFCTSNAPVTLTPVTPGGTWTGAGVSATTGVFDPAAVGIGTHTIVYTLSCGSDSISITVGPCLTLTACQNPNGSITVSSGTGPYTWYKDSAYTNCSACPGGMCFPGMCNGVPGTISTIFATGTTATPPGTYPIHVTDASSTTLVITNLASLPNCSTTCPPLTVTTSNIVMDSCSGQSNGSFSASTSGGATPWSYVLKNSGGTTVATFNNIAGTQSFTGLAAGTYTLNVLDNNACPGTTTITITQPTNTGTVAAAGSDQSGCSNSTILAGNAPVVGTGVWTLVSGTGTITTPSSPTSGVTGLGIGTAVFQWTISNPPCSSTSDQVSITNTGGGPTVTISSQTNISCYGGSNGSATATAIGGSGTLTYHWTASGGNNLTANSLAVGTYTITATDSLGCIGVATVPIIQPDSIHGHVTTTPTACGGSTGSASIAAGGGTGSLTYTWSNSETTSTINNLSATTYSVTVTDSLGCSKTVSGIVGTTGGPTANAGSNVTIITGSSTQLTASGGGTYSWTPPTGLGCDTCQSTLASPVRTTSYCVTVSVNGCSDSACVTITVVDSVTTVECGTIFIPNSFTPGNNDNLNDVFKPITNCIHDYSFIIFNRWGEKVFETSDTTEGWNGYYKNKLSKQDVYIYKITFLDDPKNDYHQYVGYLTLLK